jgi:preprotein translocase subunit YajC
MEVFIQLLESFGLPVAIIVALGFFIYKIYTDTTKNNKETITQMQQKCQAREEKLYDEISKNREVISQAIATISKYAEKLDVIQNDVNEIKTDVIKITEKLG